MIRFLQNSLRFVFERCVRARILSPCFVFVTIMVLWLNTTALDASSSGTIADYSTGISKNAGLGNIVLGPDGNLWFTEDRVSRIGRITTRGIVTEFSAGISANAQPENIVVGRDGNLWFREAQGIGRITTSGVVTEFSAGISADGGPNGIALGPDGNVWFTETFGNRIARITPTGSITEFQQLRERQGTRVCPTPNPQPTESTFSVLCGGDVGAMPGAIALGPDGNLWFIEAMDSKIGRITSSGIVTQYSVTRGNGLLRRYLRGIAAGPDGNLWFGAVGRIGRITPAGSITFFPVLDPDHALAILGIDAIVIGHDAKLWFTGTSWTYVPGKGTRHFGWIGRVATDGGVELFSLGVNSEPQGIVAASDGSIWFTDSERNRIGRLTP